MRFDLVQAEALPWEERPFAHDVYPPRQQASATDGATPVESNACMWRYPAPTRGRRHLDPDQKEIFVPLRAR